ncbi:MAG: ABC transporter substrate-binding protein [Thermoleophilia bacterium]|nr:ABC transporter substrate-binding protein [Thermoleophilia bacterium]
MEQRETREPRRWHLWLLAGALVLSLAAFAAACGGDAEAAPEDTTPAETEEPPAETEEPPAETEEPPAETEAPTEEGTPIKLGILSDCEGAFGAFYEVDLGGAALPMIARGATPAGSKPSDGLENLPAPGGHPIEIVGYGCADDTPEKAIEETRRLIEQLGAEIMIGPLSGDEGIAVANYAKEHPEVTILNGTSGAQDTTLKVQAPNFFRFNSDGAQWNAGLGDYAYNVLGWKNAATIADDYSFAWTSAAGFIAEFCAVGGQIPNEHRIWAPLNETDYSSYAAQLAEIWDEVDGVFLGVGGAGAIPLLKAMEDAIGPIDSQKVVGNLFYGDPVIVQELGDRAVGIASADSMWPDSTDPKATEYLATWDATWPELAGFGASVFAYNYVSAAEAMLQALEAVGGDLSDGHAAFREALAGVVLDAPYGQIKLDSNRQAIQDNFVRILTAEGPVTVWKIPQVAQDFGGTFTADTPPPDRTNPTCEQRELPWAGNAEVIKAPEEVLGG